MCLALGYAHPDVMLRHMSAMQYAEWLAFYRIEPFGDGRADLRSAIVASVISNRLRGKNENAQSPIDFMPFAKTEQTPEEIKRQLRSILGQVKHGHSRHSQD